MKLSDLLTRRMDDLTGLPPVESQLTCIVKTNSRVSSHEDVIHISISAGKYFYSYIIIPATITQNIHVYTITHD